jgi:hypothetical protein
MAWRDYRQMAAGLHGFVMWQPWLAPSQKFPWALPIVKTFVRIPAPDDEEQLPSRRNSHYDGLAVKT